MGRGRARKGSGVTERSGRNDDDKTPALPEVTVPPWLRTGPAADPSVATPKPTIGSATGADGADAQRADVGEPEGPPTRITLGAQGRDAATDGSSAPGGSAPDEPAGERRGLPTRAAGAGRPVDDLSTLPLRSAAPAPGPAGASASAPDGARDPGEAVDDAAPATPLLSRRPARIALAVAAGAAVLGGSGVLGFVVVRGASGSEAGPVAAAATPGCEDRIEDGRVTGSGPGSLDSPAGAVLAFDHAYYVARSAEKAFEAVAPSSRMTEEQLRVDGIDRLAEGTTHCVQVSELAPTLLEVELTELPPESEPVLIRQRVRVAENPDGTWGIVSITPAG